MTPFLRVWANSKTDVTSSTANGDVVELTVIDASSYDIDDVVTLFDGTVTLVGRIYHVDYSTKVITVYAPGHSTLDIDALLFSANFMFYSIPHMGEIRYLEWRNYSKNLKGITIPQPSTLQPIEWRIPVTLNGVDTSCLDRTLADLLLMFEALSNKKIVVEMIDEGFQQRLFDSYITNDTFQVVETTGEDILTTLTFVGLLEVAV